MTFHVIFTPTARRQVEQVGLTASDVEALASHVAEHPELGEVIRGSRGFRKVRFGIPSRGIGRRGGVRAVVLVRWQRECAYVVAVYSKAYKSDLTPDEIRELASMKEGLP